LVILRVCTNPDDLLPNTMLQAFNDASNSLSAQSDRRQRGDFSGAHSLSEVEPENHTVALLIRARRAAPQMLIDLLQEDSEGDSFFAALRGSLNFRVDIAGGNMRLFT